MNVENINTTGGLRTKGIKKKGSIEQPLVSIITVVKDRENVIEKCILSVLNQTYSNIEYIVIDGASTDATLDIITGYSDSIDYYLSEEDDGIYDAMNKGIHYSTGEYIILLNSDDRYCSDAIETLVSNALRSNADITHSDCYVIDNSENVTGSISAWLDDGIYTKGMPLRHETMLIKREIYITHGLYNTNFKILSDYDLTIRLYTAGCSFYHVQEELMYFRDSGISNNDHDLRFKERETLFQTIFPFLDSDDLILLRQGITTSQRLDLVTKHAGKSELFSRSMAFNIANYSEHKEALKLYTLVNSFKKNKFWPLTKPLRKALKKALRIDS